MLGRWWWVVGVWGLALGTGEDSGETAEGKASRLHSLLDSHLLESLATKGVYLVPLGYSYAAERALCWDVEVELGQVAGRTLRSVLSPAEQAHHEAELTQLIRIANNFLRHQLQLAEDPLITKPLEPEFIREKLGSCLGTAGFVTSMASLQSLAADADQLGSHQLHRNLLLMQTLREKHGALRYLELAKDATDFRVRIILPLLRQTLQELGLGLAEAVDQGILHKALFNATNLALQMEAVFGEQVVSSYELLFDQDPNLLLKVSTLLGVTVDADALKFKGVICTPLVSKASVFIQARPAAVGAFSLDQRHFSLPQLPDKVLAARRNGSHTFSTIMYMAETECLVLGSVTVCPSHAVSSEPPSAVCAVPPAAQDVCEWKVSSVQPSFFHKAYVGAGTFAVATAQKNYHLHCKHRYLKAFQRNAYVHSHKVESPLAIYRPAKGCVLTFGCSQCSIAKVAELEAAVWPLEPLPQELHRIISEEIKGEVEGERFSHLMAALDSEERELRMAAKSFRVRWTLGSVGPLTFLGGLFHFLNYTTIIAIIALFLVYRRCCRVKPGFIHHR